MTAPGSARSVRSAARIALPARRPAAHTRDRSEGHLRVHPVEGTPLSHTLVVLSHPDLAASRINAALAAAARAVPGVEVRDLAALYPDGRIDVRREQAALAAADDVVLQYPTHWYSVPGLLKQWLDDVLVRGWAYGTGAPGALVGKTLRVVTSTGGAAEAYVHGGFHGWPYEEVLIPMKATAKRLGMRWVEPIVVHGARDVSDDDLAAVTERYREVLGETEAVAA